MPTQDIDGVEFQLNDHETHDGLMPNAYPRRKMFSSSPVAEGLDQNDDNRTGGMRVVKKLAEHVKKDGELKK